MNEIYGLPNKDRTAIIEERRLDSKKWLNVPWSNRPEMHPTANQYIAAGWLLKVVPVLGAFQHQGQVIIGLVEGEYTYGLDDTPYEERCCILIGFCKTEAKANIVALLPMSPGSEYRDVEANMLARMGELLDYKIDNPLEDHLELMALKDIWTSIKDIRANSNLIEYDVVNEVVASKEAVTARFNL